MPVNLLSSGGGTTTLTNAASASNFTLTLPAVTGTIATTATAGKVLQVVQTVKTDTFVSGTTSAWFDITGMSVAITPASASNKVLVSWSLCYGGNAGAVGYYVRLVRNSTAIALGNAAGSRLQVTQAITPSNVDSFGGATSAVTFLDSPATTSATTYKIQLYQIPGTQALPINYSQNDGDNNTIGRWISTITVQEIAA
jgi:hypothetical protein